MIVKAGQIFYITTVPTAAIGKDNDIAIHVNSGIYVKQGGRWINLMQRTVIVGENKQSVDVFSSEDSNSLKVIAGDEENFVVHLDANNISSTEGFMLIDLSDTTNWPHTDTGHIDIIWITLNINPGSSFAGDVQLGFLTNVDGTNGDFNIIKTWHLERQAAEIAKGLDYSWSHIPLTTEMWFGPTTANDATWQTDTNLQGPDGNSSYPSGNGDLVMKITLTAGAVDVGISIGYHT